MKKILIFMTLLLIISWVKAQEIQVTQRTPFVDESLYHFGFSVGVNFMSYNIVESLKEIDGETYYARVQTLLPGFSVGFISDLRLHKYLNLRFTPVLNFSSRTIHYRTASGGDFPVGNVGKDISILSLPLDIPLYLKWSSAREWDYRPYFIVGGGATYNVYRDKRTAVKQKPLDGFVSAGFGCNFYMKMFRFCPEIRYQIGLSNILTPSSERNELQKAQIFYTDAILRMYSHMISITFNFE